MSTNSALAQIIALLSLDSNNDNDDDHAGPQKNSSKSWSSLPFHVHAKVIGHYINMCTFESHCRSRLNFRMLQVIRISHSFGQEASLPVLQKVLNELDNEKVAFDASVTDADRRRAYFDPEYRAELREAEWAITWTQDAIKSTLQALNRLDALRKLKIIREGAKNSKGHA